MSTMEERIATVHARIARAAESAGRSKESVRLVAVTKGHSASAVSEAYHLGIRTFGENYAQELVGKVAETGPLDGLQWHMIGHLQTNKARLVAPAIAAIHTVDSVHVAAELGKRTAKLGRTIEALVEVNVAGDPAKTGCSPAEVSDIADAIRAMLLEFGAVSVERAPM